ncbi:oligopeptide transport system ATP-binding protein [Entomoplasma freundtii]|uniref:Oligopeptide ABC transporter ATP-binding protein n=1 Tax=Entomoplasma freundtii TaxID=74700 RepID=A0A2K8NRU8_9MOLU|nr:oligopeptide ABC transporter ATP-binding protein OppD [Entomoplasma freundtii]ATZ16560.1 oligopeptide ABC transporter ATP-binding protein [Entomoplasma freundtii]TDY58274.1 oligopeptide transport system ATP-binding protein [Entomoplasma freundtii]
MEQKKVILSIQNLVVKFRVRSRVLTSIRNVSFDIYDGETVAIVGESGSGKSVLTKTLTNMLESNGYIANGAIFYYPNEASQAEAYFKDNLDLVQLHKGAMEPESRKGIRKYNHLKIKNACSNIKSFENLNLEKLSQKAASLETKLASFETFEFSATNNRKLKQKDALQSDLNKVKQSIKLATQPSLLAQEIEKLEMEIAQAKQETANFNLVPVWKKLHYTLVMMAFNTLADEPNNTKVKALLNKAYDSLAKVTYKNDFEFSLWEILQKFHSGMAITSQELETVNETWKYFRKVGATIRAKARKNLKHLRGGTIATIFQDPMTSLNPLLTVGYQISEVLRAHQGLNHAEAKAEAIKLMQKVGIPKAEQRYHDLPSKYSGGMRQRIVIAVALAAKPKVLICDEPTTALDVTIQAQILELIRSLKKEYGFTVIFITHDLGVVANIADRVAVVYAGQIIEYGETEEVFFNAQHPYTWALLSSLPQLGEKGQELYSIPGSPPSLFNEIIGDAFAPRNQYALAVDYKFEPPFFEVSPTHSAKTWLLDPRAPKVKRPKELNSLSAAVEAAQVGGEV